MLRSAGSRLVALDGTELAPLRGVKTTKATRTNRRITLTIHLRSRAPAKFALEDTVADIFAGKRPPLTRAAFAKRFGASPDDIALVRRFARRHGFRVSSISIARRMLHLTGGTTTLAKAFGVTRIHCTAGAVRWDSYAGRVSLPIELAGAVDGVYGFDTRPEAYRGQADQAVAPPATVAESYSGPGDRRSVFLS